MTAHSVRGEQIGATLAHVFGLILAAVRSKDAVVVTNSKVDVVPTFDLGVLAEYEESGEVTHSVSVTHRAPPVGPTTREALALAVLASDDRAAASALADFAIEEGVDYGVAAYERGLAEGQARERERVGKATLDFVRQAFEGFGGREAVWRDVHLTTVFNMVENHFHELASFLKSGQTIDEYARGVELNALREELARRELQELHDRQREIILGEGLVQ